MLNFENDVFGFYLKFRKLQAYKISSVHTLRTVPIIILEINVVILPVDSIPLILYNSYNQSKPLTGE